MAASRAAAIGIILAVGVAGTARAERFDIPPGRIGAVAAAIGAQAGITIAVPDPELAGRPSPGVRGDLSVRAALARALRGTDAEAIFYDRTTIRIARRRAAPPPVRRPAPAAARPAADPEPPAEIIVTASKQTIPLDSYPGSVKLVMLGSGWDAGGAAGGTSAITKRLPVLGSTDLGPARNKLFIRNIADSSFNGPTQATVGQYLGDVRLNYNAPDPNLTLYDMRHVEVLVGPQGTLYGASSLGGIIRLVPNAPDTSILSATAAAGISATRFGGVGGDGAAMINLPVVDGRVAVRIVAHATREAGYIDDPSRRLRDINDTTSYGNRISWRVEDPSGLTVDLGIATQNSISRDGQYVLRGDPPLTRRNALPQPFRNTYYLGYLTAHRMLGRAELVSTTSVVRHDLRTIFDATGDGSAAAPLRFEERNAIALMSHETRISGGGRAAPWVTGIASLYNESTLARTLGPPDAPMRIAGVVNRQFEAAVFGQGARPILGGLTGTAGGRLTFARSVGNLLSRPAPGSSEPFRNALRFSGTAALDWRLSGRFSAFLHYQQGYRAGGLAVAPSGSAAESRKFTADDLNMNELGIRLGDMARDRLAIRAALFYADWDHIQADLIDGSGLPYTSNVGDGRIFGLDGDVQWRPSPALTLSVAGVFNHSMLYAPAPGFETAGHRPLPNVARASVRAAAGWRGDIAPGIVLSGEAALRYVGRSRLGAGPLLDIPQGGYIVGDIGGRLDFGRFALSLNAANVGDTSANSFAFGNPFGLARRDQRTPLRPRTVRIGIAANF